MRELVDEAGRAGIPLAVASNAPLWWIEHRLDGVGLRASFELLIGIDIASAAKPDPAPFRMACQALGVDPGRSVAIEDSAVGVRSAVAAGCVTVACPGPLTLGHDVSAAHWVVASHREITFPALARVMGATPGIT